MDKINNLPLSDNTDKKEFYKTLNGQLKSLLENETHPIPNLANASALLNLALADINWVGFYLLKNDELLLGPFQGKPACIHIPIGREYAERQLLQPNPRWSPMSMHFRGISPATVHQIPK